MATRFYFQKTGFITLNPPLDPGWEVPGGYSNQNLYRRTGLDSAALTNGVLADTSISTVITTTQDYMVGQWISGPIPPQRLTGTFSLVIRCSESATTTNISLAAVAKVISQDGSTSAVIRGTLFSNFNNDTEFALTASAATRIINAQAITPLTTQPGDRLVVELGGHAAAPTAAGSFILRYGFNATSDFALTSGLTTDLNPWCEFSQDIWTADLNNYQQLKVPDGISVSEKIR